MVSDQSMEIYIRKAALPNRSRIGPGGGSELGRDLFDRVSLNSIADLPFREPLNPDATFHAGAHFIDFILEAAQGLHDAFINDLLPAAHADLALGNATRVDDG